MGPLNSEMASWRPRQLRWYFREKRVLFTIPSGRRSATCNCLCYPGILFVSSFKGMGSKMKPAFAFSQDVGAYAIVTNCERAWYLSASQSQTPCTSQGRNPRHVRWRDYIVSDLAAKLARKTELHMPFSKLQSVAFMLKLTNLSETTILTFFSRTSDTLLASCSLSVGSQWLIRIVSTCFE